MKTLSVDLRERILASYDAREGTREETADRYRVRWAWSRSSCNSGGKPGTSGRGIIIRGRKPRFLIGTGGGCDICCPQPDLTLAELRAGHALSCSLPAIHYALAAMNLTYKKRHSTPVSRPEDIAAARELWRREFSQAEAARWCFLDDRRPRPT